MTTTLLNDSVRTFSRPSAHEQATAEIAYFAAYLHRVEASRLAPKVMKRETRNELI